MKRQILILLVAMTLSTVTFAGSGKKVYIVFTSLEKVERKDHCPTETGIAIKKFTTREGQVFHTYYLLNKGFTVSYGMGEYEFYNSRDYLHTLPVQTKPKSFLTTIDYIDWDAEAPRYTKAQAEMKYKQLAECESVYFIDRRDFTGNSIVVAEAVHSKY